LLPGVRYCSLLYWTTCNYVGMCWVKSQLCKLDINCIKLWFGFWFCLFLMRFVRVSGLAVCFFSFYTFPVMCARAGCFRVGCFLCCFISIQLLIFWLPATFSTGPAGEPYLDSSPTGCSANFFIIWASQFIAVSTPEIGAVTNAPLERAAGAWVHLKLRFRGVLWNKECCRGSARLSWTIYKSNSRRCAPWSFGPVFT
jgi:hypothetical protein